MPGRRKSVAAPEPAPDAANVTSSEDATAKPSAGVSKKIKKEEQAATFTNCDMELWAEDKSPPPATLPTTLHCLDVFAGCGGLHMDGTASYGSNDITLKTICAVEIEQYPAATYQGNFPDTNVLHMGIGRFLATARRLHKVKISNPKSAPKSVQVLDVKVVTAEAQKKEKEKGQAASTKDKQLKDDITLAQIQGVEALPWLSFLVKRGGKEKWEADANTAEMVSAIHQYLNSDSFGSHKFPLPGDVQILSGGPPCQGWSGYNTQRVTGNNLSDLMEDTENRLLGRFLEVVWFFRPLYVLMEEVPDVATKGNVMEWMEMVYAQKGYSMKYNSRVTTGQFGCPQTRDRLIVMATLNGLTPVELPTETHAKYKEDEERIVNAFDSSTTAFPLELKREGSDMLRTLVLGDSLSCDLPIKAAEFRGATKQINLMEDSSCKYESVPPTPFISYLRQDMDTNERVKNHVVYRLGLSDTLRSNCVPFHKDASWREMMGEENVASMLQPMMMVLTDEQWEAGDGMATRWCGKIPDFMRKTPKGQGTLPKNEIPPLRHNWSLKSHRFPLVPYWCLTMKHGKDHGCYGRLPYDRPHDTVHSYHKPHWHPSLVPFGARVMSVREKARVQGFPDNFVFKGDVGAMYKQIGNAVSPQLTKGIARAILTAHSTSLGDDYKVQPTLSRSLEMFCEYIERFDFEKMAVLERHMPGTTDRPQLEPMSYEEILIEYNTETRSDHSSRYKSKTPFGLLDEVENYRNWRLEAISGVRRTAGFLEVCVKYPGWPEGFDKWWVDMQPQYRNTRQWNAFEEVDIDKISDVLAGKRQHYCLPGCDYQSTNESPPVLEEAQAKFELFKSRYAQDKEKGWIFGGKTLTQYGRVMKKGVDESAEDVEVVNKGSGKGKWVTKKAGEMVADDAEDKILFDRLLGSRVSVFWDLYGWSEGVIVKAEGAECSIAYGDGSSEEVTLPDDTIKITAYHVKGEPILTKEDVVAEGKAKEAAEKAAEEAKAAPAEDEDMTDSNSRVSRKRAASESSGNSTTKRKK